MKKLGLLLLCLSSLSFAAEYDPVRGEMLSLSCTSCHGREGKSEAITPYIAGMGKTNETMMQKHAKGFSDEELEQIAYYFSNIKR